MPVGRPRRALSVALRPIVISCGAVRAGVHCPSKRSRARLGWTTRPHTITRSLIMAARLPRLGSIFLRSAPQLGSTARVGVRPAVVRSPRTFSASATSQSTLARRQRRLCPTVAAVSVPSCSELLLTERMSAGFKKSKAAVVEDFDEFEEDDLSDFEAAIDSTDASSTTKITSSSTAGQRFEDARLKLDQALSQPHVSTAT